MSATAVAEEQVAEYQPHALAEVAPSAIQLMLDLEKAGLITPRTLTLPDGIEYASAEALAIFITEIITRGNFYMGDLLVEAEQKLGDSFSQLAEATGRSERTRLHVMAVCTQVPPARRKDELLWDHHVAVHKLNATEQKRWLGAAVKNGWSAAELRRQMKADRTDLRPELPGVTLDEHEPDTKLLLEAARALVRNAEVAGENVICRVEDYTRVKAALGEE